MNACPVDNTPEFKTCHHCPDCVLIRAWTRPTPKPHILGFIIVALLILAVHFDIG
jgi:hypothetical protein